MNRVVVDASLAMRWLIPRADAAHARTLAADAGVALHAPDLIWSEVANALWKYGRAGADPKRLVRRLQDFRSLPLRVTPADELVDDALAIALEIGHPVYDCIYIALAIRTSSCVVTADRRLHNAVESSSYARHVMWHEDYLADRPTTPGKPSDADA